MVGGMCAKMVSAAEGFYTAQSAPALRQIK